MQKAFKDIVERLEEKHKESENCPKFEKAFRQVAFEEAIEIVNRVAGEYKGGWIPCSEQLPPHSDELLLIQCSGKPRKNIEFKDAFCLASYTEVGWILELYPDWEDADVVAWKPLGEPYQPKGE